MISLVTRQNSPAFFAVCDRDVAMGPEIATLLAVYGVQGRMADFWVATNSNRPTAAISRENGQIKLVMTPHADAAELRDFLASIGGFDQIWAQAGACARLFPGVPFESGPVMRYEGEFPPYRHTGIVERLPLDHLYELLCLCFDEFNENGRQRWCAFASHLFRHRLGTVDGIYAGGHLACTGGVYAQNSRYGVIACVATHPADRGRGYAARVVHHLSGRILRGGKIPALLCANDGLADYYGRLGFGPLGRWGKIPYL